MKINLAQFLLFSLWLMSIGSFLTLALTGWFTDNSKLAIVQMITVFGVLALVGYGMLLIFKFMEAWDDKE